MPAYNFGDESKDDYEPNVLYYTPEEQSLTKYNIVICEKYNRKKHGIFDKTTHCGDVKNHFLTIARAKQLYMRSLSFICEYISARIEIAECIYLPSDYCVSILKTHWLRLIQRTWKKIYHLRKLTLVLRCHPNALKHREIYGGWPDSCISYPGLKGMLSYLSRTSSRTSS